MGEERGPGRRRRDSRRAVVPGRVGPGGRDGLDGLAMPFPPSPDRPRRASIVHLPCLDRIGRGRFSSRPAEQRPPLI